MNCQKLKSQSTVVSLSKDADFWAKLFIFRTQESCWNKSKYLLNISVSLFHLLRDEESLMLEFFPDLANIGSAAQDYFDSICVIFYDHLRPKIVKLHHLETLSEISSILKVELMEHTSVSSNTGKNKE